MDKTYLRWVKDEHASELVNYYHLARVAGKTSKYDRMIWASNEFAKQYGYLSSTAAYKDLEVLLA